MFVCTNMSAVHGYNKYVNANNISKLFVHELQSTWFDTPILGV
jgi:hypothetical protein